MREIIVVGCGPAGMMAAITAAREGAKVTILEGMDKPGKKLLLTGNGRCNLTNLEPGLSRRYRGSDPELVSHVANQVFSQFQVSDTLHFFDEIGLLTTEKNGCLYPYTNQSSSVLDLLISELGRLGVKMKYREKVKEIRWRDGWWDVDTSGWTYRCDRLIIACGSRCAAATGSDGSGYSLAQSIGHTITPVLPALTGLISKEKAFSSWAGVRCHAKVSLCVSEGTAREDESVKVKPAVVWKTAAQDTGELQWTEHGISGIVVFQVSRYASSALHKGARVRAILDFIPDMPELELRSYLDRQTLRFENKPVSQSLAGLLPAKLLLGLFEQLRIRPGTNAGAMTEIQKSNLVHIIKHYSVPITGTRGFDQCQVCAGGIDLREINALTLQSKIIPELSFAGEILDIDGPCGGYNLQWAWSSGYAAGYHAACGE